MEYVSTRGGGPAVSFREATLRGLAPDGGLYVPASLPPLPSGWDRWGYEEALTRVLGLFGAEDVAPLVAAAASRYAHPEIAPLVEVGDRLVLELFWGPTLSFKDHAMQVVARLLERDSSGGVVLGATSGDTGSAAMEALRGADEIAVVILYPDGMVSEFQRRQMTTIPEPNVKAVAVEGTFDDCQALVKEAFSKFDLLAINSINWGRVACQVGYYVHAGARMGERFDVVVPTGNFGNVYSCWLAKQMGVPVETITIANNANHGLADLVASGRMSRSHVVATSAPSMDVGVPSNLERFTGDPTDQFSAGWSDDSEIRDTIAEVYRQHGYVVDTHTATAWAAGVKTRRDLPQMVVATAHPAKFSDAVSSAIGEAPNPPDAFPDNSEIKERRYSIPNSSSALEELIR